MPGSSNRGTNLKQSPIRSLLPHARAAKKLGKKVLHLNIGQPDIETPFEALEAVRSQEDKIISYGPSEGLTALREKVVDYYQKFDANLDLGDAFVTTGASEAIMFALLSCMDEHEEVIVPEPFYANYLGFAAACSVDIVPITTTFETQFQLPDVAAFEALITPKTKAILLCNPGNPTGQLYNGEELRKLLHLVIERDLILIVDEVYREFCYDTEFTSVLAFPEGKDHVVVIDSISKVFSSCGARVGFLVTKNRFIQNAVLKYAQLRLCPPYFGQVLAKACFEFGGSYIKDAKEEYRSRRTILYEGLKNIEGVQCYRPDAAFYNIVQLPFDDVTPFCKWLLTDFSLDNETIMLAPADGFYFNEALGKSQVRVAYILNAARLHRSLNILQQAIPEYQRVTEVVHSAGG